MCDFIYRLIEIAINALVIGVLIKYYFGKKLEDYKTEKMNKQKAAMIAELLSEWCYPKDGKIDYNKLNKLVWEAYLWLPKDVAKELSNRLTNSENASDTKKIIADVRKIILGEKEEIDPSYIVHFEDKK